MYVTYIGIARKGLVGYRGYGLAVYNIDFENFLRFRAYSRNRNRAVGVFGVCQARGRFDGHPLRRQSYVVFQRVREGNGFTVKQPVVENVTVARIEFCNFGPCDRRQIFGSDAFVLNARHAIIECYGIALFFPYRRQHNVAFYGIRIIYLRAAKQPVLEFVTFFGGNAKIRKCDCRPVVEICNAYFAAAVGVEGNRMNINPFSIKSFGLIDYGIRESYLFAPVAADAAVLSEPAENSLLARHVDVGRSYSRIVRRRLDLNVGRRAAVYKGNIVNFGRPRGGYGNILIRTVKRVRETERVAVSGPADKVVTRSRRYGLRGNNSARIVCNRIIGGKVAS